SSDSEAEITLPGGGTLNPGKAEDFARRMEDAASGKIKPVEAGKLAALLPATLGGWTRTAIESTGVGQFGSTAEGRYELDGRRFTLRGRLPGWVRPWGWNRAARTRAATNARGPSTAGW
ncbi:MAG TPA: hypothetical protein PKE25_08700, partial [Novosphingobium sp.]|nr:hypothetical protein [Novosphingobium sp.]